MLEKKSACMLNNEILGSEWWQLKQITRANANFFNAVYPLMDITASMSVQKGQAR